MKYKVQFSKGWSGIWIFDASNDIRAWEKARKFINEHTQTVFVAISEIWELDESENAIRKLDNYDEYFTPYKINFKNGNFILNIDKDKDDYLVWNEAKRTTEKKYKCDVVDSIEQLEKHTNSPIRKLDSQDECKEKRNKNIQEEDKKENQKNQIEFAVYIAHFSDGTCSEPYIVELPIDEDRPKRSKDAIALETAKQKFKNEVIQTEKIFQEEKAVYKAYFSDGECSGPYIAEIKENDVNALETAKQKLKQHIKCNGLDNKKIKIIKIEELNEDKNFILNIERIQRNKGRLEINKKPERKTRVIEKVS